MIARVLAALAVLLVASPTATRRRPDNLVSRVKAVFADRVDSELPHVPLEHWLNDAFVPGAKVEWERSDCDLMPWYPQPREGYPVCVVARASVQGLRIGSKIHFLASTTLGRSVHPPVFQQQSLIGCMSSSGRTDGHVDRVAMRLSELPEIIKLLRASAECR